MTLGGSIFVHNAIKFDYCIVESIDSLCAICDEVVALDAQSEDNTIEILNSCKTNNKNLTVITGADWHCADNYTRLSILANQAKDHLKTDWHFMLQADEVIHEDSFPFIKNVISQNKYDSFLCRRINFFGDLNHYLRFDLDQNKKPCSDVVMRLANLKYRAFSDAESLATDPKTTSSNLIDQIKIFHYGMVRKDQQYINKTMDMQSWFMGQGSQPDHRVVAMTNGVYEWEKMKERIDLTELTTSHPVFAQNWVNERQSAKKAVL